MSGTELHRSMHCNASMLLIFVGYKIRWSVCFDEIYYDASRAAGRVPQP